MKKENVSSTNQRQNKPSNSSSLPDRKSYRAKWHNYSGSEYFVTFCTYERRHYFGAVRNGQTELTKVGKYLKTEIEKVQDFYPYAEIPIYVIMPDHVHLIMEIRKDTWNRENADAINHNADAINHNADAINRVPTGGITGKKNPMLNATLGTVVRGLKARVTQFARQNNIPFKWQPRYHDRIIRNRDEMNKIAKHIELNPAKWESQYSLNRV
jgi:REP element-mobilizing transposase RayT